MGIRDSNEFIDPPTIEELMGAPELPDGFIECASCGKLTRNPNLCHRCNRHEARMH